MPLIARSPEGKVTSLWGTALIRGADGQLRALKVGDTVRKGDQILTTQDGIVQIANGDAEVPTTDAKAPAENDVDRAIAELNAGDRQAAPAAGLTGGDGGSLEEALRVDRISEGVGSAGVPRITADADLRTFDNATGTTVAPEELAPTLPALGAPSSAISAAEEGSITNLGLTAPSGAAAGGSIRVGQVPAIGEIHKADGTLVAPGTVLAPADLPGLVYVPPTDYDGTAPVGNFVYTLTADGQTVTGGTIITLSAVNDAPVATPGTVSGIEDGTLPVSLGGTDVDGRIVGVTVTAIPAGATLLLADGVTPVVAGQTLAPEQAASLLLRPAADFAGDQTLLFTVTDNGGAVSAPAAVSLTVVAVNDLPVPTPGSGGSGTEDTPVAVRLGGTDVDGTVTAVTVSTLPTNGTLYLSDGVTPVSAGTPLTPAQAANLVFVPNPDFNGNVTIVFTATDNDGGTSAPAAAVVNVAPVDDAPVAAPDSATFAEDSVATGNVLGNDSDVDGPSLAVASFRFGGVSHPAGSTAVVGGVGTLAINADGSWTFTPALNFNGPVPAIQVTTTDGSLTATSSLSLTVTAVNDAPLAQADLASTPINTPATITVLANDSDVEGEALTVTGAALADPSQGTVVVNVDGTLGFMPATNFSGTATISYTVRDASGASSSATVTVNVGNNNAPDSADVTRSLPEDGSYAVQAGDFGFSDTDAGQTLASVRIDSLPAAGMLLLNGAPVAAGTVVSVAQLGAGALVFVPAPDGSGAPYASFGFSVQDSAGAFDATPNTFRFDVTPVNDAPVAASDAASTNEDAALVISPAALTGNDSDVDGDTLTISSVQDAVNGAVALVGGNVVFAPAANYNGPASFTYTVSDGNGGTATATVNLTIEAVGDAAVISSGAGSVTEDTALIGGNLSTGGTLTVTDPDAGEAAFQPQAGTAGAYGTFTLAADGTWSYVASNSNGAIQSLGAGQALTETFTVRSVDGTTSTVVVTINGTNDVAVLSSVTGSVTEDAGVVAGNIATGGSLTVSDADAGQAAFQPQASTAGTYGTFTLAADGAWTYTAANANPAIQALGAGQTLTETFTVRSVDGTTSSVVVTINGTNDVAVISAGAGSVTEDVGLSGGNIATGGSLTVSDADAGQAAFQPQASTAGTYGTFTLAADGAWTYTAANANPAIQALGAGQTLTETFTVRSTDGTTSTVVVTINGTNDVAVISAGSGSVTEDVSLSAGNIATGGSLTVSDADAGQAAFQPQASTAGAYGTFTLAANGTWTYSASNSNAAIQALGAGQTLTETFTVRSVDGTTSSVVVTINGTNDVAVISAGSGSVTEDVGVSGGNIATGGMLSVSDPDAGQATFQPQASTAGAYGTFTLAANGAWTYTATDANPAIQALGAGQTLTETFTVRSVDGTTATVVVTINGTNDVAVISAGSGSVTEDVGVSAGNIATGGMLSVSDADAGQATFQPQASTAGAYGTFTLAVDGNWAYTASNSNAAIQALGAGQTLTETFTVRSTDGTTSTVVVTINGTNDVAVISAGSGSVTEDVGVSGGNIATVGMLSVSDPDAGQAAFQPQASTAGAYGTFALAADGNWAYTASNSNTAIQALGAGQTLTETFTVRSVDGTTSSVVVTINGTNDVAVISTGTGAVTEDAGVVAGNIATGGSLSVSDFDAGQAAFQPQASTVGAYGTFTLSADGAWTYTAANANPVIQALGAGQTLTETFTVRSIDGTTSTLVVTINGTNDVAVVSAGTGSVTEDVGVSAGNIATGGSLTVSDADAGQAAFQPQASTAGSYGTFTLAADGTWTYSASNSNAAIQSLGAGQTLTETFTVRSTDGTTSTVVVTINGTNDVAVVSAGTGSVTEDVDVSGGNIATGGMLSVSDPDAGQATFQPQASTAGAYGTFTLAADGSWAYTASNSNTAIQALGAGQTLSETFTVRSVDGTTSSVVVTINGTNDVAVISAGSGSVTEDVGVTAGNIATGGMLTVTDADTGQASFQPQASTSGTYGTFTLAANGAWTYSASNSNAAIQSLGAGQTLTETFTVRSTDGTTSTVVVTINGTNDVAVISTGTGAVTEDAGVVAGNIATGGSLTVSDADAGQAAFQPQALTAGAYGTFTVAADGAWTYSASNSNTAIQALGAGQTLTETFTVRSVDGTTSTVVVTINGTNDVAVISTGTGSVTEDVGVSAGNIATGGSLTVSDVDAGQAAFQPQASTLGAYGTFTVAADGAWTYTAANANPAIQALGAGQTLTETFTVRSVDGTTATVVVTINGTNDVAVISAGTGSVTEDAGVVAGTIATGGLLTVSDADAGQAAFQPQASTAGAYGTFTLAASGAWTYSASNSNATIQALGAGQTLTETFTVRSVDGTTSTVVVTINGTNDAAVISAGTGSLTEDVGLSGGNIATGGSLTVSDADAGQTAFQPQASTAGTYGTFTLAADGTWTYSASNSNPAIQTLGAGDTLTETFIVRSIDGTTSTVVVTINGTNDVAVISAGSSSITEDVGVSGGTIATGGSLTVSDADAGQAAFQPQASTAGAYGTFTLAANGTWTYTAANANPAIQALGAGQALTETFTVRSIDGTTSTVVVTINGTNDAAVISASTGSVTEDVGVTAGNIATGGTLSVSDADAGQSGFQPQASTAGSYGTFTLAADGTWAYSASNSNTAIQALGAGQTLTETFTVRSVDGTTSTVVVTINGTNDVAVISTGTGSVTEDVGVSAGNIATGGSLTVSDADAGQAAFQPQASTAGAYGTFTLAANGAWTYSASNSNAAIQALGAGQTLTETFTVRSVDGTTSSVVVTINGTNDVAVISTGTGSVTEDVGVSAGNIATSGTLTVSDADAGQAAFQPQASTVGAYGTFTLAADGAWTYTAANANPAIQALGAGQTLTETFTVRSVDGTTSSVVVTINGTNDVAVISAGSGSVTEDVGVTAGNIATGGMLTVTDADTGQAIFQPQAATAGTYGTFTLAANGAWTYSASNSNAAIQALGAGQTLTETFTVRSVDGTTSTVVVTINGTNDVAVISTGTGSVTEDVGVSAGNIATGGSLTVSDADAGQAAFQPQASTAGAYGTFTLAANGAWTYSASNSNAAIQALGAGQTLTETFTVRSTDGTTSTVVVTINGTNDVAVISTGTGSVTEDVGVSAGNIATGGSLTVSDADAGQAAFQPQASTAGAYGTFTLAADGAWTYTAANANPAIQALGAGQTLTETFTVRSTDGTTSTVVVTINGTNDVAVISTGTGSVTEDVGVSAGNIATGGSLTVSDADAGQAAFQPQASTAGTYGTFTLAADGAWTYSASNSNTAIQALGAGQTLTESFTVRSVDGTTSSVVVTINGTNDVAVISAGRGSVTEDVGVSGGNIATGGSLTVSDADAGQAVFQPQAATAGAYGTFALAANGAWTYSASNSNAAIQALGAGQTLTETFTVRSVDGTTSSVVVTINGTNDVAVISTGTGSVTEDVGVSAGNIATSGTLTVSDADAGQAAFQPQASTVGAYGTFTLAANGAWTYSASNSNTAIQALGAGQTLTETFIVRSIDGTTSTVVVTINGTNDVAVISAGSGSVTEDVGVSAGNIATSGTLTVSDADAGQAAFQPQASTAGAYGTFVLAADGSWTYTAANANPAIQALGAGQTLTEIFTVRSVDGTTATVVVTINGTNDVAVISAGSGSVTEDVGVSGGNIATGGMLSVSDPDAGQATFQPQASTAGAYGTFTLAANGAWTYTATNANPAIQALGAGQTLSETFTVRSVDGTTSSVVVTINGTNDVAVFSAGAGSVTEDAGVVAGNIATGGSLTVSDADAGQAAFQPQASTAGAYGTFTLAADGTWTYTASNSNTAIQALGAGQTLTETFTVRSVDGTTSSVVVTINGTNDVAVISTGTGSVAEDVGVSGSNIATSGSLTVSDADAGQASFQPQASTAGTYGTFTLAADGSWAYTASNSNTAIQALGAGQTLTETFTVRSVDGTTSTVVVTINGTNDAPVALAASFSVAEDAAVVNGSVTATDVDNGTTLSYALNGAAPAGLTFNANGSYSFNPANAAYQSLGAGQSQIITVPYTVTDNNGATSTANLVITVNGVNDAPTITGPLTGTVREDTTLTAVGTLVISDADAGQSSFVAQASTAGTYGSFSITSGGVWTYTLANAAANVQALPAGSTVTESFVVTSADGTPRTVTITVNGINDAPVAQAASFTVAEDAAVVNGTVIATDVDTGSTLNFALSGAAPAGLTFNNNGSYSFNPANAAYQSLGAGQSQIITVPYTVTDNAGATSTANLVITVTGTNDVPVANANSVAATEDVVLTIAPATLLANDTDIDSGDVLSITSVQGAVGGTVALSGGNVVFTPTGNYSGPASFTYTVSDGKGGTSTASVNVNVAAVADAPTLVASPQIFSIVQGGTSLSTEPGITQANLEAALGLPSGQLDGFAPPTGPGTNDPGNVNVVDGKTSTYTLDLGTGNVASFGWQFFNGENTVSEINNGFNDLVVLVVTDPSGNQQYVQLTSSEQTGANTNGAAADATGTYTFTATSAGQYQFSWLVLNGGDSGKDSSLTVAAPSVTVGGTSYGAPIALPINDGLVDRDGSETLSSLTISGVPSGAAFSAGTNLGSGVWSFTPAQLDGLKLLPASGYTGTLNLTLSSTATETSTGETATSTQTVAVTIEATTTSSLGTQSAETLTGTSGNDSMQGFGGNDTINAGDGNDLVFGGAGNDTIDAGNGNDIVYGGSGDDVINGGAGVDRIYGGAGNDTLTGGAGSDVFAWTLADHGAAGTPATDTITDFNTGAVSAGGDVLDLRDLLTGTPVGAGNTTGNLANYLDFSVSGSGAGATTTIHISTTGQFSGGVYAPGQEDQTIVLQGVDLPTALGLGTGATDAQIIQELLTRGKLVVDNAP